MIFKELTDRVNKEFLTSSLPIPGMSQPGKNSKASVMKLMLKPS